MKADSMNDHTSFRLITSEDVDLLSGFFDTLSESTRKIYGFPFTRQFAENWVQEGTNDPNMRRYLVFDNPAERGKEPVMLGTVWMWQWTMQVVWFGIIITDAYQNKGYGSTLIDIAVEDAKRSRKGGILLTTHKMNFRAQKLYQKHGFEIIGEDSRGEYLMLLNFSRQNEE
ncbi:GNAT family N-acetyltransferase [Cohnella soli]|uniref:GNAT family N-acetyltransferase n=1 Tax=Cohnella soli TaxID=425005 RepID=A0ABW0HK79_9BACL